ncbi:hypothetical protein DM860_004463 [Cuscuta australis]|uniref:Uncharacterized protein n=1 Tax=Cuscuta australis TaxID=267555 RepID=A0A328E7U5_9ASTE|nr:hypothetical protein DM860_004463 [Cuscuta australis]
MASSKYQAAPYPSAARLSDSDCYQEYSASLKCSTKSDSVYLIVSAFLAPFGTRNSNYVIGIEDFNSNSGLEEFSSDKSKCQKHFDMYKECKKKEASSRNFFLAMLLRLDLISGARLVVAAETPRRPVGAHLGVYASWRYIGAAPRLGAVITMICPKGDKTSLYPDLIGPFSMVGG